MTAPPSGSEELGRGGHVGAPAPPTDLGASEGRATNDPLVVERRGAIGWLIFNRPSAGNAMDARMLDALQGAWRELDDDESVRVIVNTGVGSAFSTGLDMVELARNPDSFREQSRRTKRAELRLTAWHNSVRKPVIAAVNGICAGGGLHFVVDADVVIASSNASFLDPHVSLGQVSVYEVIGLARKVPAEAVIRMAMTGRGERIDARRAYALGLISQVVDPPAKLWEEAQRLAETIARNSPEALAATKAQLWNALELGLREARLAAFTAPGNRAAGPP